MSYLGNYQRSKDSEIGYIRVQSVDVNKKISWGEPAKIVQAKMDRRCPHCGAGKSDGFDIGIENGKIFGARCECGFSF